MTFLTLALAALTIGLLGSCKKVHFSQGNLWADSNKALHFEANQYSPASSWDASHISHFTWSSTEGIMHHAATNEMLRRAGYQCLMDYYVKLH